MIGPFNFCFASLVTKLPSVTESKWSAVVKAFVQDPVVHWRINSRIWQQTKSSKGKKKNLYCELSFCRVNHWITNVMNSCYPENMLNIKLWWYFFVILAFAVYQAGFGHGTGPVFLTNVGCTGTEYSLLSCSHRVAYCLHSQDAGVVCPPCK